MALVADTYPVMTLGEAQAIRASWPMGSNQQRTQAEPSFALWRRGSSGRPFVWSTWYSSYEAPA